LPWNSWNWMPFRQFGGNIRRLLNEQVPALITEDGRVLGVLTPAAFGALRGRAVLHDDLIAPVDESWHADATDSP